MDNLDDWVSSVVEMNIYDLEELLEYCEDGSYLLVYDILQDAVDAYYEEQARSLRALREEDHE